MIASIIDANTFTVSLPITQQDPTIVLNQVTLSAGVTVANPTLVLNQVVLGANLTSNKNDSHLQIEDF